MAVKKQFVKSKNVFKVTFTMSKDAVEGASKVALAGDFNNWDTTANIMKKQKNGSFSASIYLDPGRAYQYRYLIDDIIWENDWEADSYIPHMFGDGDNSLVIL